MSNVASLELCKELYKLSGWEADDWFDHGNMMELCTTEDVNAGDNPKNDYTPAYDLGYLIRKLPTNIIVCYDHEQNEHCAFPAIRRTSLNQYEAFMEYLDVDENDESKGYLNALADNPEDATVKLCIELIKLGELK